MSNGLRKKNIADGFKKQSKQCIKHGSELNAAICREAAKAIFNNQKLEQLLSKFSDNMSQSNGVKRFLCAIHALQIAKKVKKLDEWYLNESKDFTELWMNVELVIDENFEFLKTYMRLDCIQNEVGRAAIILGAMNEVAKKQLLPLCLYELEAKAGLNLCFDQYDYEITDLTWGAGNGACKLSPQWQGDVPQLDFELNVVARNGCDTAPLFLNDKVDALRVNAAIPADKLGAKYVTSQAVELVKRSDIKIDKSDSLAWIKDKLSQLDEGHLHLIYHSVAWQTMEEDLKEATLYTLQNAHKFAKPNCIIAHLSFEYNELDGQGDILLRVWDGRKQNGEVALLGTADEKGDFISWGNGQAAALAV